MPIRSFMGGMMGGPRDRGPRDRGPGPRDRGPHGGGLFSGVRLFHGPIRFMFFGRPIILTTGRQVGFLCGIVAFFVMLISTFAVFSNASSDRALKKEYEHQVEVYKLYNTIIDNADNNIDGYGIDTEGIVTQTIPYYDYYGYLSGYTYKYTFSIGSQFFDNNYTETLYKYSNAYSIGDDIEIAYVVIDGQYISIETDFKLIYNSEVNDLNAEIASLKSSIKTETVAGVILIIILVGVVALMILATVKTIKKSKEKQALEDAKMKAEVREAEAKAEEAQAQADMKHRYCTYCGAKFGDNDNKCPNCGSVHFDIKK